MFKKLFVVTIVTLLALLFSACSAEPDNRPTSTSIVTSTSTSDAPSTPDNLEGEWNMTEGDVNFKASVTNDNIKIVLNLNGQEGLYWNGTFPSSAEDGADLVSTADTKSLKMSLYGSSDKTKQFTYANEKLVFSFKMMGVTRTIALSR